MERKEVFISYKSEDFDQANWLRSVLETNGISCWMAPASIPGGSNYAKEIPQAIENCRVFVLVMTERCQTSIWIPKELDRALNARKPVMPFVLENCQLNDDFNFYLSNVQRYAAYQNKMEAAKALLQDIRALLHMPQEPVRVTAAPAKTKVSGKGVKKGILALAAAAVLLLAVVLFGKIGSTPLPQKQISASEIAKLPAESCVYLVQKAQIFLCDYGVERLALYTNDGTSSDLNGQILSSCCTGFALLEKGYTYLDEDGSSTLILPFCVSMEDVPYHWVDNVYYEEPVLVDHPALYGYAVFQNIIFDKKGNLPEDAECNLNISDLFESENRMMTVLSETFPQELKAVTLESGRDQ